MTPLQSLYVQFWTFVPPIVLAMRKAWWVGILAFIAFGILSIIITFCVSLRIPPGAMMAWAWIKPALIGGIVFATAWTIF